MNPLPKIEALINGGDFEEARRQAKKYIQDEGVRLSVLAAISSKEGDDQQAELLFDKALKKRADEPVALLNLGKLYLRQRKIPQALDLLARAYEKMPKQENTALAYAAALSESDKMSQAVEVLSSFAESEKPSLAVVTTYSSFLRADLRASEALDFLERMRGQYGDSFEFEKSLSDTYAELDPREAQKYFRRLAEKANPQMQWNRSFVELRLQEFQVGWELYETGLSEKIGKIGRPLPHQIRGLPLVTNLNDLDKGKWTLFTTEQGIGDQVLFFAPFREALETFPRSALICEQRMVPLLARSFPNIEVYPYAFGLNLERQLDRINGVFPIGSLQKHLRSSMESFGKTDYPYLKPNKLLRDKYRELMLQKRPGKVLIGLSWTGGYWDRQMRTKSIPFEDMIPVLRTIENAHFVCLQYGDIQREKEYAKKANIPITFIAGLDFKKQIDNWFALAAACDYTISVSTAIVHFMGAIGQRVELLLTERQAPFIWGTEEGPSLPYPTVNIHRRKVGETNETYMTRIQEALCP